MIAEVDVGVVRRDGVDRRAVDEADGDDRVVAALGELAQPVLAVGVVLAVLASASVQVRVEVLDDTLDAGVGGVVEGLVATAAHVVGEPDLGAVAVGGLADVAAVGCLGVVTAPVVVAACAGGQDQRGGGQAADHETCPVPHFASSFARPVRAWVASAS